MFVWFYCVQTALEKTFKTEQLLNNFICFTLYYNYKVHEQQTKATQNQYNLKINFQNYLTFLNN